MRTLVAALALAATLVLGTTAVAPAEKPVVIPICLLASPATSSSCAPRPEFDFSLSFAPRRLPRKEMTPVAVGVQAAFQTSDGSLPPAFSELVLAFDKNTVVDARALPACGRALLETLGTEIARHRCRDSIVGFGTAHVAVPSFSPNPIPLQLTLFNGGVRDGKTTLLIHSFIAAPGRESLVAVVKIGRVENERYGLEAVVEIPRVNGADSLLLDFTLEVKRARKGVPDWRYALARCFDEHLNARMTTVFQDGTRLIGSVIRGCTPTAAPAASSAG
ncbi:MAG TPA: hypothetical protein VF093_05910 [Solirubrobacterales bacterium]